MAASGEGGAACERFLEPKPIPRASHFAIFLLVHAAEQSVLALLVHRGRQAAPIHNARGKPRARQGRGARLVSQSSLGKYRAGELKEGKTFKEAAARFIDEFETITEGQRSPIYV